MKNISRHFTCLKGTVCAVSRNLISRGHHGGGTLRACRVPHDVGLGSASRACFCAPRRKSHPSDTITQQHHHDPALCLYALVDLSQPTNPTSRPNPPHQTGPSNSLSPRSKSASCPHQRSKPRPRLPRRAAPLPFPRRPRTRPRASRCPAGAETIVNAASFRAC